MKLHSQRKGWLTIRKILGIPAILLIAVASVRASSITPKLIITADPSNTPGLFDVAIQVQSNGVVNPALNGDGGVAVIQFDVVSNGVNLSAPVQQTPSGPNSTRAKITYNQAIVPSSSFGTETLPQRRDAIPADNQSGAAGVALYNQDGDLDAMAGVLADTGLTYGSTQVGVGGFQTIATEYWQLNNPTLTAGDTLTVFFSGGSYYDFNASQTNFLVSYTTNGIATAIIGTIPEPNSLTLSVLGALGLVAAKRRRTKKIATR